MWKLLKISEKTFSTFCNFNDNTQDLTFILYDLKITWCETLNLKNVKQKVKLLNRRFDFNEDNIKEALTSDAIHSAILEDGPNLETCLLKLKYRVKSCLLNYEWCLKKQNLLEFRENIVQPLLLTLLGCQQQIEILTDNVRKKDIELKQFRIEGAELNRRTLVTKPFNFDNFTKEFESCNKTTNNFMELAKYVKEIKSQVEPEDVTKNSNVEKTNINAKTEENTEKERISNIKMSPRQKKRKANDIKIKHLQQHLKLRRQGLEYESSQSQTLSSGSSQTTEISDSKKQKQTITPRTSARCSTMKRKQYKISSDDKTDSESEDYLKTSRQTKTVKSLSKTKADVIKNNNTADTKVKEQQTHHPPETKQTKIKSINLSNNSLTTKAENIIEDNNIFDFDESDDDKPLLKRKTSQKTKNEQDLQTITESKVTNKSSLSPLNKSPVLDFTSVESINSMNSSLSQSTPIIINEISSQLNNIKKELETLEALRLADLQQRTCKV